jgi:hypothetical protein
MRVIAGVPSAVEGSNWPDNASLSGRPRSDKPLKTDAERRETSLKKWSNPLKGKAAPDGSQRVSFFGPASRGVFKLWENSLGASDAKAHGAYRENIPGKGDQIVYPSSDEGSAIGAPTVSGFIDTGEIVPRIRRPDGLVATVAPVDPDEQPAWAPPPESPDYGHAVNLALAEVYAGNPDSVRGLHKARDLYRTCPIVGSVATVATVAEAKGTSTAKAPRKKRAISPERKKAIASHSVKATVGVSMIEAARVHKHADRPALCDARKAPIRQILAF